MRIKYGHCAGCGKRGIISWRRKAGEKQEPGDIDPNTPILVFFGSKYHCCDDECYEKARGVQKDVKK